MMLEVRVENERKTAALTQPGGDGSDSPGSGAALLNGYCVLKPEEESSSEAEKIMKGKSHQS